MLAVTVEVEQDRLLLGVDRDPLRDVVVLGDVAHHKAQWDVQQPDREPLGLEQDVALLGHLGNEVNGKADLDPHELGITNQGGVLFPHHEVVLDLLALQELVQVVGRQGIDLLAVQNHRQRGVADRRRPANFGSWRGGGRLMDHHRPGDDDRRQQDKEGPLPDIEMFCC